MYFSCSVMRRGNTSWERVSTWGYTMNLDGSVWGAYSLSSKQLTAQNFLELAYLNSV